MVIFLPCANGLFLKLSGVICAHGGKMHFRQNKCWGPRWEYWFVTSMIGHNHEKWSNKEVKTSLWIFISHYITKNKSLDQIHHSKSIILWFIHQKPLGNSSLNFMGQFKISQTAESWSLLVNTNIRRSCNWSLWHCG